MKLSVKLSNAAHKRLAKKAKSKKKKIYHGIIIGMQAKRNKITDKATKAYVYANVQRGSNRSSFMY